MAATVLVVDDEADIRAVVRDVLEEAGYAVDEAVNGQAALDYLMRAATPPDVILLDLRMPVVDGWEFARRYRTWPPPRAPIVGVTAAADAQEWCRQVQADGCCSKPFQLAQLLGEVARFAGPP